MKTIDELGISLTPWKSVRWGGSDERMFCSVYDSSGGAVCDCLRNKNHMESVESDARLIAAAPELYEYLREAVNEYCYACPMLDDDKCTKEAGACFVQKWRTALEKAGGEE